MQRNERTGKRVRVGVVFGGRSAEHDVSLRSAETVMGALQESGYEVVPIGVSREGRWLTSGDPMGHLQSSSPLYSLDSGAARDRGQVIGAVEDLSLEAVRSTTPSTVPENGWAGDLDVIFPVLHGPMGEDGTVQGLFDLAGMPYVGAGVMSSSVAMDKAISKLLFRQAGISQVSWLTLLRNQWRAEPDRIARDIQDLIGYPCFVKPANLGSSVGVSKAHGPDELEAAVAEAGRHDRKILVEQGLDARELEISVLGNDDPVASVVGEVLPGHEFYDYEAKYVDDSSELSIPADIPNETAEQVRDMAVRAFRVLDCNGMARVDFFLCRETGQVYLNELNTIPGFTAISMYPKLWEASGLPLPELVSRLVELAVERYDERNDSP